MPVSTTSFQFHRESPASVCDAATFSTSDLAPLSRNNRRETDADARYIGPACAGDAACVGPQTENSFRRSAWRSSLPYWLRLLICQWRSRVCAERGLSIGWRKSRSLRLDSGLAALCRPSSNPIYKLAYLPKGACRQTARAPSGTRCATSNVFLLAIIKARAGVEATHNFDE